MAITTLNNRGINRSDTASADQVWTATSATASDFQAVSGGKILQSISAVVASANGTTTIAWDDTTPLVSEGTEIFSQSLTPASTSNKVRIHGVIQAGSDSLDTSNGHAWTIFRDSTLVGVYAYMDVLGNTDTSFVVPIDIIDSPSSTSAIDYSVRIGMLYRAAYNLSDWYVGRTATASIFNGQSALNTIELNEISG